MIPGIGVLPVAESEWLARYILRKEYVRADGTVKPEPFIPYRLVELSVTRHLGLDEHEIWNAGETVAQETEAVLYGRADTEASVYLKQRLRVVPKPLKKNPNHADVIDWPTNKRAQKEKALLIAKEANYKPKPQTQV